MRHLALLLIVGAGACSSGLLEASMAPPSGLQMNLTSSFVPGVVPASGTITGKGDSVVAVFTWPAVCNRSTSSDAGIATNGNLVITVLLTSQGVQNCSPLNGMTQYRAAVHGVPAGAVNASAHIRLVTNGANSDSSIVAAVLSLP